MNFKKIIFFILLAGIIWFTPGPGDFEALVSAGKPAFVMVVDAGHGGPDGGAEAADGTMEKELNLAIAKELQRIGEKEGIRVILTRETEDGLYDEENTEKKWRKLEDLNRRKEVVKKTNADVAVSIHLNSFWSDTGVRGAQVFYPKSGRADVTEASRIMAEAVQNSLVETIDDGSNRIQMGKDDFYLFTMAEVPTILVECGFLSNPDDLANLKEETYQRQLAAAILEGVQRTLEI